MNTVMDLQRSQGHHVVFVTDAKPTQKINANETIFLNLQSRYQPNWRDGHVWLQIDRNVAYDIEVAFRRLDIEPDLVVAHDLHSFLGCEDKFRDCIFVQHESDVMNGDGRYSFLSDEYLREQIDVVNMTGCRIGMCAPYSRQVVPYRAVYTPPPITLDSYIVSEKTRGLLYIGDATDRKGAREFMAMARALDVTPTVIAHEHDPIFAGTDFHSFTLTERAEMFKLISECKVAFIPSKNECFSLVILECAQFIPTVVDSQYQWTEHVEDLGVLRATGAELYAVIDAELKGTVPYDRRPLEIWARRSQELWINLTT
jgi:hypothetical protein